jgi:hypothetical protein
VKTNIQINEKDYEIEFDENLSTLTYEYDKISKEFREVFSLNENFLVWRDNDLLWKCKDHTIEFKNVNEPAIEIFNNRHSLHLIGMKGHIIKNIMTLTIPQWKPHSKFRKLGF